MLSCSSDLDTVVALGAGATPFRTQVPQPSDWLTVNFSSPIKSGLKRAQVILSLLELRPTVLRGNASEILAIAGGPFSTACMNLFKGCKPTYMRDAECFQHLQIGAANTGNGVDSTQGSEEALAAATSIAKEFGICVAVSGATDLVSVRGEFMASQQTGIPVTYQHKPFVFKTVQVTDGTRLLKVANGCEMLTKLLLLAVR